ncbi:MAG: hypothetical protein QXG25_00635 [Nitrososphaerota archaeon]
MMDAHHLLLQSMIAPLIASPIILALGGRFGRKVGWIALIPLVYSVLCLITAGYVVHESGSPLQASYPWVQLLGDFILLFDGLSGPIAMTIAVVGLLACIYSIAYMDLRDGWLLLLIPPLRRWHARCSSLREPCSLLHLHRAHADSIMAPDSIMGR